MAFRDYFSKTGRARKLFEDMPHEPEAFTFELFSIVGTSILATPVLGTLLKLLGRGIGTLLIALSPAMPFDVRESNSFSADPRRFYLIIIAYAAPITFFFCVGLNAILTLKSGTFSSSPDPERIDFVSDGYNIFLFGIICPAYVSAALCLIVTVAISWKKLNSYSNAATAGPAPTGFAFQNATRVALFVSISMLIVAVFIPQFGADLANHKVTDKLYWFFDRAGSGERVLNVAGVYYLVMNAILLFITSMAAFCYVSMSIELFRLGKHIRTSAFALKTTEPHAVARFRLKDNERLLRASLADFSYCYVIAKILVLLYAVNIFVWQLSRAGKVANVHAAIGALLVIGLVVLVLPRLYLGSKWHRLKVEYSSLLRDAEIIPDEEPPEEYEYKDVRTKNVQKLAFLLDLVFMFALAFILYRQYGKTGVLDLLLEKTSCFLNSDRAGCGP